MNLREELKKEINGLGIDALNERIRNVEKKLKNLNLSDKQREDLTLEYSLLTEKMEALLE